MRKRSRQVSFKRWLVFLVKIVVLVGLIWGLKQVYLYAFTIKKVTCIQNQTLECPVSVKAEIAHLMGQNLLKIETETIKAKILGSSPRFTQFDLESRLPGEIQGKLFTAEELAQLKHASFAAYFVVLDNFAVAETTDSPKLRLPVVEYQTNTQPQVGQVLEEHRLRSSLDLLAYLNDQYIGYREFVIATDSARVTLNDQQIVWFDPIGDYQKQVTALQLVKHQIEGEQPTFIDVRFDKPIVRYD